VGPELRLAFQRRKRCLAGKCVEENAAERIDIGPGPDPLAPDLLRRHVVEGPQQVFRDRSLGIREQALGQTEIGQVGVVAGRQQDVRGLDVAMDEPLVVGRVEG